jgi:hypothetical protein
LFSDFQNITEIVEGRQVNFTSSKWCDNVSKLAKDTVIMNMLYVFLHITQNCQLKASIHLCSSTVFFPLPTFYNKKPYTGTIVVLEFEYSRRNFSYEIYLHCFSWICVAVLYQKRRHFFYCFSDIYRKSQQCLYDITANLYFRML